MRRMYPIYVYGTVVIRVSFFPAEQQCGFCLQSL